MRPRAGLVLCAASALLVLVLLVLLSASPAVPPRLSSSSSSSSAGERELPLLSTTEWAPPTEGKAEDADRARPRVLRLLERSAAAPIVAAGALPGVQWAEERARQAVFPPESAARRVLSGPELLAARHGARPATPPRLVPAGARGEALPQDLADDMQNLMQRLLQNEDDDDNAPVRTRAAPASNGGGGVRSSSKVLVSTSRAEGSRAQRTTPLVGAEQRHNSAAGFVFDKNIEFPAAPDGLQVDPTRARLLVAVISGGSNDSLSVSPLDRRLGVLANELRTANREAVLATWGAQDTLFATSESLSRPEVRLALPSWVEEGGREGLPVKVKHMWTSLFETHTRGAQQYQWFMKVSTEPPLRG